MGYFKKLDKIDKIVISLTFIIVTFSCIFNTFCNASTLLTGVVVENLAIDTVQDIFYERAERNLVYFKLLPGHKYSINCLQKLNSGYSYEIPTNNGKLYDTFLLQQGITQIEVDNEVFIYFSAYSEGNISELIRVTDETPGLKGAIGTLFKDLNFNILDKTLIDLMPFILPVVTFSLGVWFIKHNIIEYSKGRDF